MRVTPKSVVQQDMQALHRIRERQIKMRTALVNQIRGLLSESGNGIDPLEVHKMLRRKSSRFHQGQEPQYAPTEQAGYMHAVELFWVIP